MILRLIGLPMLLLMLISQVHAQNSGEQEYECLAGIALLPVMQEPEILASRKEIDGKGGTLLLLKRIQDLADKQNPSALYSLAILYQSGHCIGRDNVKALSLIRNAADLGNAEAQFELGGRLMRTDCAQAMNWWEKAARQGIPDALYNLGSLYRTGCSGILKDVVHAYMWYTVIAMSGSSPKEREQLAGEMTATQLSDGERLAREWTSKYPSSPCKYGMKQLPSCKQ